MKFVTLIVSLVAVAMLLGGCDGDSKPEKNTDGEASEAGVGFDVHKQIPAQIKTSTSTSGQTSTDVCSMVGLYLGTYQGKSDSGSSLAMLLPNGKAAFISYSHKVGKVAYGIGDYKGTAINGNYYTLDDTQQGRITATIYQYSKKITGTWENTVYHESGTLKSEKVFKHENGYVVYEHTGFLFYNDESLAAIYDVIVYTNNSMLALIDTPDRSTFAVLTGKYDPDTDRFKVSGKFDDGTAIDMSGTMSDRSGSIGNWSAGGGLYGKIVGLGCYVQ